MTTQPQNPMVTSEKAIVSPPQETPVDSTPFLMSNYQFLGTDKPSPLTTFKYCKICGRGRVAQNWTDVPQFSPCDYCKTIHVTAYGWLVVVEEEIFRNASPAEVRGILISVMNSFAQMAINNIKSYVSSPALQDFVNTGLERFGTRAITFRKSNALMRLGLSDFQWLGGRPDSGLLMAHQRLETLAQMEATGGIGGDSTPAHP